MAMGSRETTFSPAFRVISCVPLMVEPVSMFSPFSSSHRTLWKSYATVTALSASLWTFRSNWTVELSISGFACA